MENTLENKLKFFAQYWNQRILYYTGCTGLMQISGIGLKKSAIKFNWLVLKPISLITDNDALHLGVLLNNYISSDYKDDLKYCKDIINRFNNNEFRSSGIDVIDFLRSKGYALPYLGLSVEKQIEYGWIKLVE